MASRPRLTLGAKDEVTLSFKIGGIVGKVLVDDGARVRRGQVLAALDQREIDAMFTKATAGAEKARRDAQRVERLYRDSVVTLAQQQDARRRARRPRPTCVPRA